MVQSHIYAYTLCGQYLQDLLGATTEKYGWRDKGEYLSNFTWSLIFMKSHYRVEDIYPTSVQDLESFMLRGHVRIKTHTWLLQKMFNCLGISHFLGGQVPSDEFNPAKQVFPVGNAAGTRQST